MHVRKIIAFVIIFINSTFVYSQCDYTNVTGSFATIDNAFVSTEELDSLGGCYTLDPADFPACYCFNYVMTSSDDPYIFRMSFSGTSSSGDPMNSQYYLQSNASGENCAFDFTSRSFVISETIYDQDGNVVDDSCSFAYGDAYADGDIFIVCIEFDTVGLDVSQEVTICFGSNGIQPCQAYAGEDTVICENNAGSPITLTATGGNTYEWDNGLGSGATHTVYPTSTTTYTVTVDGDASCTDDVTVFVNPLPQADAGSNTTICEGSSAQLNASGGETYIWNNGSTLSDSTIYNPVASPDSKTTYTVTVTDEYGCQNTDSVVVEVAAPPEISGFGIEHVCFGDSIILTTSATGNAPFSFSWTTMSGDIIGTGESHTFYGTSVGSDIYHVNVTDINGCTDDDSFILSVHEVPDIDALPDTIVCDSYTLPEITGTNLSGNEAYYSQPNGNGTQLTGTLTSSQTVYIYDENSYCSDEESFELTVNISPSFTVSGTNPTLCGGSNGYITISGLNPNTLYAVSYNDGNLQGPLNMYSNANGEIIISNLSAGIYQDFTVELESCSTTGNTIINLTDPDAPFVDAGEDQTVCDGDTVVLTATNPDGATISWNNGISDGVEFVPNVGTITYIVTATKNACVSTDSVLVTVNIIPRVDAGEDVDVCENNTVTLTAYNPDGAYISWNNSVSDGVPFLSPLGTTTYTVTANLNACINIDSVDVTTHANPTPSISGNDFCEGDSAVLDAGAGYQSYIWNPLGANSQTITITGGGTYSVVVVDANGCEGSDYIDITMFPSPTLDAGEDQDICLGESATLLATSSANSYQWDNNLGSGNMHTVTPSVTTEYSVTVTDEHNCTNTDAVIINVHSIPQIQLSPTNVSCNGLNDGSINAVVSGGQAPYQYNWSNGSISQNIYNLAPNTYSVTVHDYYNCSDSSSAEITEPQEIDVTLNSTSPRCHGDNNIVVNSTVSGGMPPYSFLWNTGDTSEDITNVSAGEYVVTVTDNKGCEKISYINITEPDELVVSLPSDFSYCNNNTTLSCSVIGGVLPYSYLWSTGDSTSSIVYNTDSSQTYSVTVTDANHCVSSDNINITIPTLELFVEASSDTVCSGTPVEISTLINGGTPPYTLYSGDSITSSPIMVYPEGQKTFDIKVVDECGLTDIKTLTLNTYESPVLNIYSDVRMGCEPLEVNFIAAHPEGNYLYEWSFGDGGYKKNQDQVTYTYQNSGVYDVNLTVTSDKGCKTSFTKEDMITVYPSPNAGFTIFRNGVDFLSSDVKFNNYSTNGYSYVWDFGDGHSSNLENPFHKYTQIGDYKVQLFVYSDHGCVDSAMQYIEVEDIFRLYIPTAFSPDGDGINDEFVVKGHGILEDDFALFVYDRWGEVIWKTNDIFKSWNGRTKDNKMVQPGVYTWLIKCRDFNNILHEKSGTVNIIR